MLARREPQREHVRARPLLLADLRRLEGHLRARLIAPHEHLQLGRRPGVMLDDFPDSLLAMSDAWGRSGDVEIELFDMDDECRLQVDFGLFGFGSTVESPEILRAWAAFMAETFRTGKFLDEHVGGGVYRRMPEKLIELGHAGGIAVRFIKDGKYDDRYFVAADVSAGYFSIALTAEQAEHLVTALNSAVAVLDED